MSAHTAFLIALICAIIAGVVSLAEKAWVSALLAASLAFLAVGFLVRT